ncbi:MAG: PilZ domain-containing protein [Acidobacteriota bacterium]
MSATSPTSEPTTARSEITPSAQEVTRANPPPVLAVGLSDHELRAVSRPLSALALDIDRLPSATAALELIAPIPVQLLLVRCPLDDMAVEDFLTVVRRSDAASRFCSIILLSEAFDLERARALIDRGANRVVHLHRAEIDLFAAVADLLRVAPRKDSRFLAQLQSGRGRHMDYVVGEVLNSSATGALVESPRKLQCGAQVRFHFSLPGRAGSVVGVGEVVRHTRPAREQVDGMGLRFLSFQGDSRGKFLGFLNGHGPRGKLAGSSIGS